MKHLKPGCLAVDDTHPRLHATISGLKLYKVAVGLPGTIFYPRLPGYRRDWLPGCVVEVIYAATGSFGSDPLPVFIERARELGFYAHLDRNGFCGTRQPLRVTISTIQLLIMTLRYSS